MDLELFKEDEDVQVDMSPMIDMVFLLLIFFIVASIIVEDKVSIEVPVAEYAKVPDDITGRFIISVTADGQIYVGKKPVTLEEMKEILRPQVEEDPKLRIMIRADGNLKYKVNEKIMTACAEVGAMDLIYSAYEQ
jgi:biopolymer transport protein ExbD